MQTQKVQKVPEKVLKVQKTASRKKNRQDGNEDGFVNDGSHAIEKFRVSDAVMMFIIIVLCLTCVFPFIHVAAKSLSSNSAVMAQKVTFLPVSFTADAYRSLIKDGKMVYSLFYSVGVTVVFAILGVAVTMCAAYPLTHKDLPFRGLFSFLLVFPVTIKESHVRGNSSWAWDFSLPKLYNG